MKDTLGKCYVSNSTTTHSALFPQGLPCFHLQCMYQRVTHQHMYGTSFTHNHMMFRLLIRVPHVVRSTCYCESTVPKCSFIVGLMVFNVFPCHSYVSRVVLQPTIISMQCGREVLSNNKQCFPIICMFCVILMFFTLCCLRPY